MEWWQEADRRSDVDAALAAVNSAADECVEALGTLVEAVFDRPSRRLAVYGSLGPGRVNHHVVADIEGVWRRGTVRGRLIECGWGAAMGYPALVWEPGGECVALDVLESAQLVDHWDRLDAYEGEQYRRIVVTVEYDDRAVEVVRLYAAKATA